MYQGGGLIFAIFIGLYIRGAYVQRVLMYRGHNNGILLYFHLESKLFFKDSSKKIDMVVNLK